MEHVEHAAATTYPILNTAGATAQCLLGEVGLGHTVGYDLCLTLQQKRACFCCKAQPCTCIAEPPRFAT
jgi:hypothetical protein